MRAVPDWTVDRARRDLAGYAVDDLSWTDYGTAVVEVLGNVVGFEAGSIAMVDPASGLFTELTLEGIDGSLIDQFMRIELTEPDNITMTTLADQPSGVGILADSHQGDPQSNARCRELLGPIELEHELRSVVRIGGRMWGATALYRSPGQPGFSADDAAMLSSLEHVLAHGIQQRLRPMRINGQVIPSGAVMVLDDHDVVEQLTPAAHQVLTQLNADSDSLPTTVRTVAAAARASCGHGCAPAFLRTRTVDGTWLAMRAACLHDGTKSPTIAVIFEPTDADMRLGLLVDGYGLTEREAAVVSGLLSGASTSELASHLHLSPYTIQDHLKAVFSKVGVSSRRELTAHILGVRPLED